MAKLQIVKLGITLTLLLGGVPGFATASVQTDSRHEVRSQFGHLEQITDATPASENPYAAMEQALHEQINQHRQAQGLPPLTLNEDISQQARFHSQAMASGQIPFSHEGFDQRIQAIAQTISYQAAAENVAYNYGLIDPVAQTVQGWLNSPGHRTNIEGDFDLTGVGIARNERGEYYFTQIFIRRS